MLVDQLPGFIFSTIVAAVVLIWRHQNLQRYRARLEQIHRERVVLMEKGIPVPELPDYDSESRPRFDSLLTALHVHPRWSLGAGAILVCGGIGTTIALRLSQEPDHYRVWSMGLIPIFIGLGLFLHYRVTR